MFATAGIIVLSHKAQNNELIQSIHIQWKNIWHSTLHTLHTLSCISPSKSNKCYLYNSIIYWHIDINWILYINHMETGSYWEQNKEQWISKSILLPCILKIQWLIEYLTDVRTLNVLPMYHYLDFKYILFWPTCQPKVYLNIF